MLQQIQFNVNTKTAARRIRKGDIYAAYGIEYKAGKIRAPFFGWINPLLVNGNSKLGKGVWTWSMLPGNFMHHVDIDGDPADVLGTCPVNCPGCYAQKGCYLFRSTKSSLARKTIIARMDLDFMSRAIVAQVRADKVKLLRIHAAGDFFSADYIDAWKDIISACPDTIFWSYTKNSDAENAFTEYDNCNIVKSVLPGIGYNFGKCAYLIKAYNALKAAGKPVYICRCGVDPDQHCTNCKGCSRNEYVLFLEHSTSYKATDDPLFPELEKIVMSQPTME